MGEMVPIIMGAKEADMLAVSVVAIMSMDNQEEAYLVSSVVVAWQ